MRGCREAEKEVEGKEEEEEMMEQEPIVIICVFSTKRWHSML